MRRLGIIALVAFSTLVTAQEEVVTAFPDVVSLEGNIWAELLILFGCFFILVSAVGVLRFPDVYTRLHASTKLVALGGLGIFGGAALAFQPIGASERVLLIFAFFFLTAPLSGYMISRASYLLGQRMYKEETSVDEWGAFGRLADDGGEILLELEEGTPPDVVS